MLLVAGLPSRSAAYSVLTHEAVIDTAWDGSLRPAILARYPNATPEQLRKAHAFAYGGVIVQDMGYYPLGTHFYSDLTHYVRSGEFVEKLVANARTLDEYAFALGSIAHYAGDTEGHSVATNRCVPIIYPKLGRKFGNEVTYADDDKSHVQTEFGFDVLQAARGRYKSEAYHDFIGFEVAEDLLKRTFAETYGLELDDVLDHADLAIGTFRFAVSTLVPNATEMAWEIKKDELMEANPGLVRESFVYRLSRKSYEKEWGTSYIHAGPWSKTFAAIIRVLPKVGPLSAHGFEPPTPETEKLYLESIDRTVAEFRRLIERARAGRLDLENRNLDTADPVRAGDYVLADQAYEKWLRKLAQKDFGTVTPEIRRTIVDYYASQPPPVGSGSRAEERKKSAESIRDAQPLVRQLQGAAPQQQIASGPAAVSGP